MNREINVTKRVKTLQICGTAVEQNGERFRAFASGAALRFDPAKSEAR